MSIKFMAAAAAASVALAGTASAATLVQNGSFENVAGLASGGLKNGNYGVYDSIPGWTKGAGTAGIELQNNATLGQIDAQDGNWYVELDSFSNSSMHQDITFADAGTYLLSFFYAPRTAMPGDNTIAYSLGSLVSGVLDAVHPAGWIEVTERFTAGSGDVLRLTFAASGTSNSLGGFIDNVSIAPAPVPLPASILLLGGALAGTGAMAARRRRTA